MSEQEVDAEVEDDIRALTWEVLISRDSLLKVLDRLPEQNRERAEKTAARLMALTNHLRKIIDAMPAGVTMPDSVKESVAEMRLEVELALRELDVLVYDLHLLLGETAVPTCSLEVN